MKYTIWNAIFLNTDIIYLWYVSIFQEFSNAAADEVVEVIGRAENKI